MSGPSSAPTDLCSLRALGFRYASGVDALHDVSLTIGRGELIVITGDNGSGKSTLLALLAGELRATHGELLWSTHANVDRAAVSFIAQDPELDPEMTCLELLTLLATLYGVPRAQRRSRIDQLSAMFDAGPLMSRRIQQLSGGQKRRVHLIAGLIADATLLLLDEPTTHLDHSAQQSLWRHLRAMVEQGRTVVVVEHDESAQEHATRHIALHAGTVIVDGAPSR